MRGTSVDTERRLVAVVEDDLGVLEGIRLLLVRWGFDGVVARDADQLLAALEVRGDPPALVLADLSGTAKARDTIARVRARWGLRIKALVITDAAPETIEAMERDGFRSLARPVPPQRLRALMVELMRDAD